MPIGNEMTGFNSKLVRLKARLHLRHLSNNGVSIPNWCD